ncbi:uncharacterized protein LOC118205776 isoform X1 [Stegodyphus dumicola]|uniref:uncharacterized protein LOC118205776 isoform X1 n=2 Tax=Stegodyphus dumicola TaxID=202533 RepID=UPI0015AD4890|nr:uncharacterized protein LOC118205776 isoform X1 [Stegodyphus dumicola]
MNYEVDLHSFPGATIERLRRKISFLDNRYHLILVHVGTNNSNDSVEDILKKYDCLFKDIKRLNPNINVIISDILPRGEDFFTTLNQRVAALNRLQVINRKIVEINSQLEKYCQNREAFFICRSSHHFGAKLLARDGLHLNRLGNKKLAAVFLDNIKIVLTSKPVSTKVFGQDVKHLLCSWHVRQSWFRQLNSKVVDKEVRQKKMLGELTKILHERNQITFHDQIINDWQESGMYLKVKSKLCQENFLKLKLIKFLSNMVDE